MYLTEPPSTKDDYLATFSFGHRFKRLVRRLSRRRDLFFLLGVMAGVIVAFFWWVTQ